MSLHTPLPPQKRQIIFQWDIIRIICTFIIICFHLSCSLYDNGYESHLVFYRTANASWGSMIVTSFFVLSGSSLFFNNQNLESNTEIKAFYVKRIKSVMLPYWVTWVIMYLIKSIMLHDFFWGGNPSKLILTVLGLDGYLGYIIPNYALIGEWFFGALIIIYAIYPILLFLYKKKRIITTVLLCVLWIVIAYFNPFQMDSYRNILVCLWAFWVGMYCADKKAYLSKHVWGILSMSVSFFVIFVKIPLNVVIVHTIGGIFLFCFLFYISSYIGEMKDNKLIHVLSQATFLVFLVHHRIIYKTAPIIARVLLRQVFPISVCTMIGAACGIFALGFIYWLFYKNLINRAINRIKIFRM